MTSVSCSALRFRLFPRSPIGLATTLARAIALAIALTAGHSTASASTDAPTSGPESDRVEVVESAVAPESSLARLPSDDEALAGIVEAMRSSFEHETTAHRALVYAATTRALLAARGIDAASLDESEVLPVTATTDAAYEAANEAPRTGLVATLCLVLSVALLGVGYARERAGRPRAARRPAPSRPYRIIDIGDDTVDVIPNDGVSPTDSRRRAGEAAALETNGAVPATPRVLTDARIDAGDAVVTAAVAQDARVPVVFDPTRLVGAVVAAWRPAAAAKGVALTLNIDSLPWRVVADMQRLRAVIDHTLHAVVAGTSATRVQVEVDADVTARCLRIVVRDDRQPAMVEVVGTVRMPADPASALARDLGSERATELAAAMGGTCRLRTSARGDTLCRIVIPYAHADAEADADDVVPSHEASPRHLRHVAPLDAPIVPAAPVRPDASRAVLDAPIMQAIEARLGGMAGRRLAAEFVLSLGELIGSARASFAADDRASLEATLQTMAGLAETFGCLPIVAAVRANRADSPTARFGRVLAAISEVFPKLADERGAASNDTVPALDAAA